MRRRRWMILSCTVWWRSASKSAAFWNRIEGGINCLKLFFLWKKGNEEEV
jgi:hypothetical protein